MNPRDRQIYLDAKSGTPPAVLAERHGLTLNRVQQILRVERYREQYQQQAS